MPIEVQPSINLRSKSLKSFRARYDVEVCVRTSLTGFKDDGWLINIPLHAISRIADALKGRRPS